MKIAKVLIPVLYLLAALPVQAAPLVKATRIPGTFDKPLYVARAPDSNTLLFVVEQTGRIQVLENEIKQPVPFLDVTSLISCCNERGLLSIAFPPNYATSGLLYIAYTNATGDVQIDELKRNATNPKRANAATRRRLLVVPHRDAGNHNGGQLQFGPDGMLYISIGDGGEVFPRGKFARDLTSLLGKILRINPAPQGSQPYTIPPDNPYVGQANRRKEIYAYGLRNPWRFSFDRSSGAMTIGDVGQGEWEEINYRAKGKARGANFGWRVFEGNNRYTPDESAPGAIKPVITEKHSDGNCSITGGIVIRDPALTAWRGRYVFGDYCRGVIQTAKLPGGKAVDRKLKVESLSSFGEDARGRVYATSLDGPVYRLVQR